MTGVRLMLVFGAVHAAAAAAAFAPTGIAVSTNRFDTAIHGNTKQPPSLPPVKDISYGEESRKYRRTVYTHDDWRKHRSPDRFFYYIKTIFSSGVFKNLRREISATTGVAAFICLYNAITGGYTDFRGVKHAALITSKLLPLLGLPLAPFTLSTPALALLLVFRTNTSYQRWDEARKNWGMNINRTRDLVRLGNAMYDKKGVSQAQRTADLNVLALCCWAFVRCMKRHLSPEDEDEEDFRKELYEKLPERQAAAIIAAAHRPNRALQDLSTAIENLPMHFMRKHEIHNAVSIFEDNLGSSERLLTSPVPLFYSRLTARFLSFWLLLLPFALYEHFGASWNHILMIPATAVISVFFFGIEELATQLEEPFTILPMQTFCDRIYNWCKEIVSFEAGDNGMTVNEPRREHMVAFLGADYEGRSLERTPPASTAATTVNGGDRSEQAAAEANGQSTNLSRSQTLHSTHASSHYHPLFTEAPSSLLRPRPEEHQGRANSTERAGEGPPEI